MAKYCTNCGTKNDESANSVQNVEMNLNFMNQLKQNPIQILKK